MQFWDNRDRLKEMPYSPPVQKTEFYAQFKTFIKRAKNNENQKPK
jgi:hypothetical protein